MSITGPYKAGIPPGKSDASCGIGPKKPDVKVTMCFGPMPPDASDFPGGIPALGKMLMESTQNEESENRNYVIIYC